MRSGVDADELLIRAVSSCLAVMLAAPWLLATGSSQESPMAMSLAGSWAFELDPQDAGQAQAWFSRDLTDCIRLPGSMAEQAKGVACRELPLNRPAPAYTYYGQAWYQHTVEIPPGWADQRIELFLERCQWTTKVWVDDQYVGTCERLQTPHRYDLTGLLNPGVHRLTISVDNRPAADIGGPMAFFDDAPAKWNGIIGRIELRAMPRVWIDRVDVYPNLACRSARVRVTLGNSTGGSIKGRLALVALLEGQPAGTAAASVEMGGPRDVVETVLELTTPFATWDEFEPSLYQLQVELDAGPHRHLLAQTFGMRELAVRGTQFVMNGKVVFLRGTVDCAIFPLTGYPDMTRSGWRRIMQVIKSYGMNHIRFHSWCPPEAAFAAADELGLMLQVENPQWINPDYGSPASGGEAARQAFLAAEQQAIFETYGNHPSFCFHTQGNELGSQPDASQLELVRLARQSDPRHLYARTTGYIDENPGDQDYAVGFATSKGMLRGTERLVRKAPNTSDDWRVGMSSLARPVVTHELSQWAMYPILSEEAKWTGAFRPAYLDWYRRTLEANHLLDQADEFVQATGAWLVAQQKEELEMQLRTPGKAGFQLLGVKESSGAF